MVAVLHRQSVQANWGLSPVDNYIDLAVSLARSLMTTSLAPTLPSEETACVRVPATSATLLATFATVLLAPSATAYACATRVLSHVGTPSAHCPRQGTHSAIWSSSVLALKATGMLRRSGGTSDDMGGRIQTAGCGADAAGNEDISHGIWWAEFKGRRWHAPARRAP